MMNQPIVPSNAQPDRGNPLLQVHKGMKVYDRADREIGTVQHVFLGEVSLQEDERGQGPATSRNPNWQPNDLLQDFARIFEEDRLPKDLQRRLQRMGFIRLDAKGLFASDRYVLPEQIGRVADNKVVLKTTRDDLIKR